jgi:hypothetical protein
MNSDAQRYVVIRELRPRHLADPEDCFAGLSHCGVCGHRALRGLNTGKAVSITTGALAPSYLLRLRELSGLEEPADQEVIGMPTLRLSRSDG